MSHSCPLVSNSKYSKYSVHGQPAARRQRVHNQRIVLALARGQRTGHAHDGSGRSRLSAHLPRSRSVHARELRAARRAATQQGPLFFLSGRCSRRPRALVRTAPRAVAAAVAQGYSAVGGSLGLLGATHHIRNHDNHSHFPISYSSGFLSSVAISPTARSLVVCSRVGVLDVCGF